MQEELTGIILAGGKSRRMGMEKGLVVFQNKPLIFYSISVLKEICGEILISANSPHYDDYGYKAVPDLFENIGPMGGIYSALKASSNRVNLVLSCDMPFVTAQTFLHLLVQSEGSLITVPWYNEEHFEPMCGIYLKDTLVEMEKFILGGNYKLPDLFRNIPFKGVKISKDDPILNPSVFFNINTLTDLRDAEKLVSLPNG